MKMLLILKIAGIAISGVMTLVALLWSKVYDESELRLPNGRSQTVKRLTVTGKISIVLAVAGLVVSFFSQALEQSITNKSNAESQRQALDQLHATEKQVNETQKIVAELRVQSDQTRSILTNVQGQGLLARQAIDVLSAQSEQTRSILTNVEAQAAIAKQSVDELSIQTKRTELIVHELERQGRLAGEQLNQIERTLTPFETIDVDLVFELSTNAAPIRALVDDMERYATRERSATSERPSTSNKAVPSWLRNLKRRESDNGNLMYALTSAFGMTRRLNITSNESFILSLDLTEVSDELLSWSDTPLKPKDMVALGLTRLDGHLGEAVRMVVV